MHLTRKHRIWLVLMLILVTVFASSLAETQPSRDSALSSSAYDFASSPAEPLPYESMARPPEDVPWLALGAAEDVYLVRKGEGRISVRAQKKTSARVLYSWRRFALRAVDFNPDEAWYRVALPGADGFVPARNTAAAPEEARPRLRAYVETASLGYVYLAAAGDVPLVMEIQNGGRVHQLLLPNDGVWQPVLLTLGAGKYKLSVYEAGLYDRPIRLLFETFFEMETAPEDTHLALLSSLHTNMESHPLTVEMARSLCENAETDREKVTLLWDWLIRHSAYDTQLARTIQFSEIPDGDAFVRGGKGICSDFAAFMAVGLRAVGVPCKHVYGKNLRTGNQHAWNEVYLDGKWQIIDVTMARSRGPKKFHTENAKHYALEKGLWDGFH